MLYKDPAIINRFFLFLSTLSCISVMTYVTAISKIETRTVEFGVSQLTGFYSPRGSSEKKYVCFSSAKFIPVSRDRCARLFVEHQHSLSSANTLLCALNTQINSYREKQKKTHF